MNIKALEITKEMYNAAKKVEILWKLSEKDEFFDDLWKKADEKFRKIYNNDFDTLEIVNEYDRRERNADRLLSQDKNVYEITYIGDATRKFKFFACSFDKETKKLYRLKNNIGGNLFPKVTEAPKIKKVECVERNNNLDFQ